MPDALAALKTRLARVADLRAAAALLDWDQETVMPEAAVEARARQLATIQELAHELFTADETGALLDAARPDTDVDRDLMRVARRDFDRARRIPPALVAALARATTLGKDAWRRAREADDFTAFRPHLETIVDLCREKADAVGFARAAYDALLDEYEPGMTSAEVARIFADLRSELVPIVDALAGRSDAVDDAVLRRHYPVGLQWSFGEQVMADLGFDFGRGRQDRSAHPFTTSLSVSDVRLTTRLEGHHFSPAFFGSLHEAGHGMYEQGIDPALDGSPLADGASLGMHESQSRLWENLVGRSLAFWEGRFPSLRETFPAQLCDQTATSFWRAVNRVEPGLIRVEADEVTYALHVMLRFDLETALVGGALPARDVPSAWNERMEALIGIRPPDDASGCLQDIHWSIGILGYFPTYALGNLMSVQLWDAAAKELGDMDDFVRKGEFAPLLSWLRRRVHRYGRRRTASEILLEATGSALDVRPWLAYVRAKYGNLYGVALP